MVRKLSLRPHPRLYAGPEEFERLRQTPRSGLLRDAADRMAAAAEEFVESAKIDYNPNVHNPLLHRARMAQERIVTLLVRWRQCGEDRFRAAALRQVAEIGRWKYWSSITRRRRDSRPEAIFDLSYGINSAALAVAYDWLGESLSDDERAMFRRIALTRAVRPFMKITDERNLGKMALADPWWFGWPTSNWNTVCAGGMGLLCLAMHEELDEADEVLERVERSIRPFMEHLAGSEGAWPEGIGYWNFGMKYAFMYLLARERATGRPHPLLSGRGVPETLDFPPAFCPNGVPCSFGDVNRWGVVPIHYAAADRLNRPDVVWLYDEYLRRAGQDRCPMHFPAELLLLHPRGGARRPKTRTNVVRIWPRQHWGILADRMPFPNMYLSVRGGDMSAPHAHRDLMSFHCVVGDEALVSNVGVRAYLDIPHGQRRYEQPELNALSKNTIIINGFGIGEKPRAPASVLRVGGLKGIHIDATAAFGQLSGQAAVKFCGRLFLMIPRVGFLILDRVEMLHHALIESRLHSYADLRPGRDGAMIRGERERLRVSYAADVPAVVATARMAPSFAGEGANVLRWATPERNQRNATLATLLTPGGASAKVELSHVSRHIIARVTHAGKSRRIAVTRRLRAARGGRRGSTGSP